MEGISIGFVSEFCDGFDVYDEKKIEGISKELPVFLLSGECDPSTNYGDSAKLTQELYQKAGIRDVELIVYPGAGHELLNEINRDEITADMINWMDKHL